MPVIYMTGNDSPAVREAALQSGCLAYLTKPFSAASLAEKLQQAQASVELLEPADLENLPCYRDHWRGQP